MWKKYHNLAFQKFQFVFWLSGSDRGLQAHVGDVAADAGVLRVLALLRGDVLKGTVPDGPLAAQTLHLVHVDGTHS